MSQPDNDRATPVTISPVVLHGVVWGACPDWMSSEAAEALADRVVAALGSVEGMKVASTTHEWCAWWGGLDPNDCAGLLVYDTKGEAVHMLQWLDKTQRRGIAHRSVLNGPWQAVSAS